MFIYIVSEDHEAQIADIGQKVTKNAEHAEVTRRRLSNLQQECETKFATLTGKI